MRKKIKNYLIISVMLILTGALFYFTVLQSVFQIGYNDIVGLNCNYDTSYCSGTTLKNTDEKIEQKWTFSEEWQDWESYNLRKPWIKEFFYKDFNLEILRNYEFSDNKGGVKKYINMFPYHCESSNNYNSQAIGVKIANVEFPGTRSFEDVELACGKYDDNRVQVLLNKRFVREESGAECPILVFNYEKMNGISNCVLNSYQETICSSASGVKDACKETNEASKVSYSAYEYKYIQPYNVFAVTDLLNNAKTKAMFDKYGDLGFLTPLYYEGYYVNSVVPQKWMEDFFNNKLCWVELNITDILKIYGKTEWNHNNEGRFSCVLQEYASLNNKKLSSQEAEQLTKSGELRINPEQTQIFWDFSKTEFPEINNCIQDETKCISYNEYVCSNQEFILIKENSKNCGYIEDIKPKPNYIIYILIGIILIIIILAILIINKLK